VPATSPAANRSKNCRTTRRFASSAATDPGRWLAGGLVVDDDELGDAVAVDREVEGQHERRRQAGLGERAIDRGIDHDRTPVVRDCRDRHRHEVAHDLRGGPRADGVAAELAAVIVHHHIGGERREHGLDVMLVQGVDEAGDRGWERRVGHVIPPSVTLTVGIPGSAL
jgi:hypothetical protein